MSGTSPDLAARARLEAELLSRRRGPAPTVPALPRGPGTRYFPASPAQEGMWAEIQEDPLPAPLILAGVRLRGPLDRDLLTRALHEMVARHETLRTTLRVRDGRLTQVVAPPGTPAIPVTDIAATDFAPVTWAEVDRPFDLEREPLFRLRLLRLAPDDHIVMLVLHHLIGDARALEIFVRDLTAHYLALRAGDRTTLPPLAVQYGDFATWFHGHLAAGRGAALRDYWRRRLDGAAEAVLPTDLEPPGDGSVRGHTLYFPVRAETVAGAQRLAAARQATLFMVGCAAFQTLLSRYSGQRDQCVRVPISYRDWPEVEDLVADFSNDIVFRVDLSANPTFARLVDVVRDSALRDFAYRELPPHLLADRLPDPGLLARLFRVQFTTEADPEVELPDAGLRAELMPPPWQYAFRPLALRLRSTPDGWYCIATYRTANFSEQRISDLVHDYLDLLVELTTHPDRPIFGGDGQPPLPRLRVR